MSERRSAVVVGAGLAGLACGLDLADHGVDVLVIESRPVVGGRAGSWVEDGMPVESGLHRWLGHYKALPALLRRAGVEPDDILCWEDEIEIRLPDGTNGVLGLAPLHRPAQTLRTAVGNNRLLSPLDKLSLLPFFATGLAHYLLSPSGVDRWTTAAYARRLGTTASAVERLLVPLTAGIFFLPPDRFSAGNFLGLVAPIVPRLHRMRLGAFTGPMTEVMCDPIANAIRQAGGEVRTSTPVEQVLTRDDRVIGVAAAGEEIQADHVILATSIGPAQRLVRDALGDHPWFQSFLDLPTTPSATIQFDLQRPAMDLDRATFAPGTSLACFSEQSRTTFPHTTGRLSVILAPPEPYLTLAADAVADHVIDDADRLGIPLRDNILRHRTVNHPADFPSLEPGHLAARPPQQTPVEGLSLAGDYTRQRFLATMEGAVISGHHAAQAAHRHLNSIAARNLCSIGHTARAAGPPSRRL